MAEKISKLNKVRQSPSDQMKYLINEKVVLETESVLSDYGKLKPAHEGLVYWAGIKTKDITYISSVIAPKTQSRPQGITVQGDSFFNIVRFLSKNNLVQVGQVHSHPGSWVDHSIYDDEGATSKVEGLISIVVPEYSVRGMRPLEICGIHRFSKGEFIRLENMYIKNHFSITLEGNYLRGDFRL